MQRVLWITGRLPYPLRSGDALYTAGLLRAAHFANLKVTVVGLARLPDTSVDSLNEIAPVEWHPIAAEPSPAWRSIFSTLPKDAYSLFPPGFRDQLAQLLTRDWDWVVFDHARSGAALKAVQEASKARLAYVAHNVERKVRPEVAAEIGAGPARLPYVLDAGKYRSLEDRLVRAADVVLTITDEDANEFRIDGTRAYHVPPVYLGPKVAQRELGSGTPKRVFLLGSFEWVAKQRNLIRFLESVGPRLASAGIGIDIAGSMPQDLLRRVEQNHANVRPLGPIEDVRPIAEQVRCGVIPEELGGGMKLKTLDYIFMRLPVFSLKPGVLGLPDEARNSIFTASNFYQLGDAIVSNIDDWAELNRRQVLAYGACEKRFSVNEAASMLTSAFKQQSLVNA